MFFSNSILAALNTPDSPKIYSDAIFIGGDQRSDPSVHHKGGHSVWSQLSGTVTRTRAIAEERAIYRVSAEGSGRNEKQLVYKQHYRC